MPVFEFSCPHCSTPLRMMDRSLVGQTIGCPDCAVSVLLRADAHGRIVGEPISSEPISEPVTTSPAGSSVAHRLAGLATFLLTPAGVAWVVAACLSAGLLTWLTTSPTRDPSTASEPVVSRPDPIASPSLEVETSVELPDHPQEMTAARLSGLYDELSKHHSQTGGWPSGTAGDPALPLEGRFSWLAVLAVQQNPGGPQPHWDHAWNDRVNDRFVRQRQDALLNPLLSRQTGHDGYPATHLVGVTGIGADAAHLPTGHPRAGVFGHNRRTTLNDVTDGLANTMLVAGVESDLGSWAAAGHSTMRGFTAEPYVSGPDGFGTGQADGMYVLMADGSTRFLSSKTDPVLLGRMAAAADGLPLDANIVSEPDSDPAPSIEQLDRVEAVEAEEPADAEVADLVAELAQPVEEAHDDLQPEVEPAVDIAAALAQPVVRFEQKQPQTVRELLNLLEEMAAVEVDTTGVAQQGAARLEQPIRVSLEDTTVGGILTDVLRQVRLSYAIQGARLEVIELPAASESD